jgi:site-specific recombinase XerD
MSGKNCWRPCKIYGRLIGYPKLKPHDLRHGVAVEVSGQHHGLEHFRALLGRVRLETTQVYWRIQPKELKGVVSLYESSTMALNINEINVVAPTGFEPVFSD